MKTALFLGAGASAFAGQPTTKELLGLMRERIQTQELSGTLSAMTKLIVQDSHYTDVEKLYDGIESMLSIRDDTTNVRPIVTVLRANEANVERVLKELDSVRDIIRDILLGSFVINEDTRRLIVQMYDKVVMGGIGDDWTDGLWVFTTNYDTVVEEYAHANDFEIVNGFTYGGGPLNKVWTDNWDGHTDKLPIRLMKLHGSIKWYEDADGNIVEAGVIPQRDSERDVLIVPTEGTKNYGRKPFPTLLERFKERIGKVDVLLAIGFSYRDKEIVNIIKDRLDDGMALISVSLSTTAVEDIRWVSDADFETVEAGGQALKTDGTRIVLIERGFGPATIDNVCILLEAAYKLIERHDISV